MDVHQRKEKVSEFLKQYKVCVLSTIRIDKTGPESAVVGFAEKENLELIIGTSNTSRKYRNLQENPNISLVVGWDSTTGSIQYEGIAQEIPIERSQEYAAILVQKNPESEKFVHQKDERYFIIKPTWIRFLDTTANPPKVHELMF